MDHPHNRTQNAASSGTSISQATYSNAYWATEQFDDDDDLIYSQEFISWIKQSGLHVGQQELAGPHSPRLVSEDQASIPSGVNYNTQTSICGVLESCRATDDHLPSMTNVVEQLLENGATPNQTNARGESLLHLAVALGHIPIVTLLLEYSADHHLKTGAGESVWQFGAKASQKLMPIDLVEGEAPDLLARTMACARIEFARNTVRFNPNLIVNRISRRKDRRGHRQVNSHNSSLERLEWMDQHTTRQEVIVNPIVEQGQYWDVPNHFDDLYFFSWSGQFDDPVLDEEPDLAWQ
ncbi:hypothetical protein M409DRAFT_28810 [Zasmidium cellare ATCC 36951]|uniref:Uncharacterized protein n=1 Tax=Zasmidium cellare ATCC 36951 TaxID=1080233 RepID=A0A6A6C3A0_ZASCE|nr:uncharacterized protein M409DRAFT_28810 [Zasmidium cellare ATCC 36951]KAF2160670.1 hypothetical protein M409DRAFT_28810 [Zasmidium cellare ATCC 36951]